MIKEGPVPRTPAGAGAAGRRLWRAVLTEYEFKEHELALLREAVRTVDQLDALAAVVEADGLMVDGPAGCADEPGGGGGSAAAYRPGAAAGRAAAPGW